MDWKSKLAAVRGAVASGSEAVQQKVATALASNGPLIAKLFQQHIGPAAVCLAQNELVFETSCRLVYTLLPSLVRLVVREDAFVGYCRTHRDRLFVMP